MASAQVVETSVTNNSPSQDSYHPDDLFQSRYCFHHAKQVESRGHERNILMVVYIPTLVLSNTLAWQATDQLLKTWPNLSPIDLIG